MSFEQILAMSIGVVILKKRSSLLCYIYSNDLICIYIHFTSAQRLENIRQESATNLADVDSIVSGLYQFRGIRREVVSVHELLSTGLIFFLHDYMEKIGLCQF